MSQAGTLSAGGGGGGGPIIGIGTDDGIATPIAGIVNIIADIATLNAGSTVSFTGSSNIVLFHVTDSAFNTIIGEGSGNSTLLGLGALSNNIFGAFSGSSITTGSGNVIIGTTAASALMDGIDNIIIGSNSGDSYVSNESNNIIIGSSVSGTVTEANTLRIGAGTGSSLGELTQAFIGGIDGVDVGSVATVVTESGDQLGTAVITAGNGIAVTPTANTITISSTGLFFDYVNVNISPYFVLDSDVYLSVDTSTIPITILFPDNALLGEPFIIKDRTGNAGTNNITLTTVSGITTIDGTAAFIVDTAYQSISMVGNGVSYEIY